MVQRVGIAQGKAPVVGRAFMRCLPVKMCQCLLLVAPKASGFGFKLCWCGSRVGQGGIRAPGCRKAGPAIRKPLFQPGPQIQICCGPRPKPRGKALKLFRVGPQQQIMRLCCV